MYYIITKLYIVYIRRTIYFILIISSLIWIMAVTASIHFCLYTGPLVHWLVSVCNEIQLFIRCSRWEIKSRVSIDIRNYTRKFLSWQKLPFSLSPRLQAAAVDFKEVFNADQLQASSPHVKLTRSTAHQTFTIMKSFFKNPDWIW